MEIYSNLDEYLKGKPLTPSSFFGQCELCGIWRPMLEQDHHIPKHKGGTDDPSNLRLLCSNCHRKKTALEIQELFKQRIGEKNPAFGKKQTVEHIEKRRNKLLGHRPFNVSKRTLVQQECIRKWRNKYKGEKRKLAVQMCMGNLSGQSDANYGSPLNQTLTV